MYTGAKPKKGVESLLGEHSNLVNLDNLVKVIKQTNYSNQVNLDSLVKVIKQTIRI